ncbi:ABC-2 type transport system permease protein [Pedococcus cremeus]|uniref:ABC-2 type transport system permease protein n=1 Tax=Pedococcus cremeus TaxID=587636 RepID=A0A1H9RC22_9MICO|nr:ABC transporter permease [Pedococcus cremeus]SER70262.1 ABC-2 type transport system permease protein [Pedococcus cremeus]
MTWWRGTGLVAQRSLLETFRSRTYRIITALLLLASAAAVVVPRLVLDQPTTYTLATVGEAPQPLRAALESAARRGDFTVEYTARADAPAVRQAVRDGDATAGLADSTLFTASEVDQTFPGLVSQAVVTLESAARLRAAGLTPEQIASLASVRPPQQVTVRRVASSERAAVGFGVGIALYLALTFAGSAISTAVAVEKSTRVSEVLLAVLRPSQVLVGTVSAVGAATLAQLLVLGVPLAVAVRLGYVGLPSVASGDLALAVVWFVLGFAVYAFLFAASAALVDKVTEASAAVAPVTTVLVIGYMLSIIVVMGDPSSAWGTVISMFPLSAPMAMPIRWSGGEVPVWQLVTAMALTAGTAVLLVYAGSAVYQRALVITGHRVRWHELFRRPSENAHAAR